MKSGKVQIPIKKSLINPKTAPYFFLAPSIALLLIFTLYPVVSSLLLSFQETAGNENVFVGLDNYIRLINDPVFYKSILNTFQILIVQVPVMLSLALLIAVGVNSSLIKFKGIFRTAFFLPSVVALATASIVFMIILDGNYGVANYLLSLIGLEPIDWLNEPFWAKMSIIATMTWRWTGYNMVIFLAGLQVIPKSYYEAASIDGASKIKQFFLITLPQLKPIFVFTVVISTISTLKLFDEAYIMTNGGPDNATMTITLYLYKMGFDYFEFGYASALAYALVLIVAIISYFQFKIVGDD